MICRSIAALFVAAAAALAQAPAHAVTLNPVATLADVAIVRSGDTIHAIGITTGTNFGFVHHARSRDGGRTWPRREVPIAYLTGLGGAAATGDQVHVVGWYGRYGPFVISSHDAGTTWQVPVRVSQQSVSTTRSLAIVADGNRVNVAWTESRGNGRAWANRSLDGGVTWQPTDFALDVGLPPVTLIQDTSMQLVADGAVLNAFWNRNDTLQYTAHQRSIDGGATWLPVANALLPDAMLTAAGHGGVLVCVEVGGSLVRSVDHGATWAPVSGHGMAKVLDVAVSDSHVLVVGRQNHLPPPFTLLINVSTDGGATWLPVPYGVPAYRALKAEAVASEALFVHVLFTDHQEPTGVVIQSDDGGQQWRLVTEEAARGCWAWPGNSLVMTRTASNGIDWLAWVMAGHTTLGQGTAGTGGRVPRLEAAGLPSLGRSVALEVSAARGSASGAFFVSFEPAAPTPLGSATLWLQQPIGPFEFTTTAAGTASLPVIVPNHGSFMGRTMVSQAFVIDSLAVDGFAMTRALETWIH